MVKSNKLARNNGTYVHNYKRNHANVTETRYNQICWKNAFKKYFFVLGHLPFSKEFLRVWGNKKTYIRQNVFLTLHFSPRIIITPMVGFTYVCL